MSSNGDHENHKEPNDPPHYDSVVHRSGQHHTFLQPLLPQSSQPSPLSGSPGPASPARPMLSNGTGDLTQSQAPSTCPSLAPPTNPNRTQEGEAEGEAEDGEGDEEDEDEGYDGENDEDEIDCSTPRPSHTNSNNVNTKYFFKPHFPDPFALRPYGHTSVMPAAAAVRNGAGSQRLNTSPTIQNQNASAVPGVAGPQAASGTGNGITSSSLVFSLEDIEAVFEDCLHFCRRAYGWSSPLSSESQSPSEPTQFSSPTEKQDAKGKGKWKGKEPAVSPPPRPCPPCSRCAASAQQRLKIARRCRARDVTKIAELEQEIEGYKATIRDLKDQLRDLRSCLEELRETPDELAADDISERHTALKSTVDILGTQIDRFLVLGAGINTAFAGFAASCREDKTDEETGEKKIYEETEEEKAEEKKKKFKKEKIEEMKIKGKTPAPTSLASPQTSASIPPGVYELYVTVSSQTRIRSPRANPPATSVASTTSSIQTTPSQAPLSQATPSQAPSLSQAPISQDPYTQGRSTKAPVVAPNGHPTATAKPVNGVTASPPRTARCPPTLQIPSDASLGRAVAVQQSRSEHLGRGPIATVRSPPSQLPPAQASSSQATSSQVQPAARERGREAAAAAERRRREARPFVDLIRWFTEERRRRNE